ncbi:nicotinamide N-methyltransferase-like [Pelobates cultripes]|uniref:Nicotinamide N-methyltransferase-like n=1 Tax=Pelobates cultripes TaxID=61616 RepID=A0AAD1VQD4_PELCU|nr:nicotinamide N-methyltransferase-like [Pelobates cultripes]
MEGIDLKHYHDEEFDHHLLIKTYVGHDKTDSKEELMTMPQQKLFEVLSSGTVKGETLIDLTIAPAFGHLMVAADFFKEIFILDSSDSSLKETEKWLNKEPGAVDWSHAAHISCKLKGVRTEHSKSVSVRRLCQEEHSSGFTSEHLEAEEEKVRRVVKHCLKWDPTNDNPLSSVVLPQADCAISVFYFGACKDHESYRNTFKKLSSLVKVGGHVILFALFNGTYFTIGDHRFSMLNYNEELVKEVLQDNGYTTVIFEVYESKLNTHLVDYKQSGYIVARKEREI